MSTMVVIGSRGSRLAMIQSRRVAEQLEGACPDIRTRIEVIQTTGDQRRDAALQSFGGEGVFVKELETALLDGAIDMAVHSLKDLPTRLPEGLSIAAIPERVTPYDALISERWTSLDALPHGARIGTSSIRRAAMLRAYRPDLEIVPLRGNVDTRLLRVSEGAVDAAILAAAGLERLNRAEVITELLPADVMLPAPGQGALAIEIRRDDTIAFNAASAINDRLTGAAVIAERVCLSILGAGCSTPLGALGQVKTEVLTLRACVCSQDGAGRIDVSAVGAVSDAEGIGRETAERLLEQGAAELIGEPHG